jgi:hypothetical protein
LPRPAGPLNPDVDPDPELERLLGDVEGLLDRERGVRSRLRSLSTLSRGLIAAGAAVLAVVAVFLLVRRADFALVPFWQLALAGASYAVPLGLLIWQLLLPLHRVEARHGQATALIATAFAVPFVWALIPPHAFAHIVRAGDIRRDCLFVGLALGGAFVALLRVLDRAADTDPRGMAMGAAAGGLVANLGLVLHCPQTRMAHLVLVHAPIGLFLLWIYRRALRWHALKRA